MNRKLLLEALTKAEMGDDLSMKTIVEVMRPKATDSAERIVEKINLFTRLVFKKSLAYKDSEDHKKIVYFYAEQIKSLLERGIPKYKGAIIYGFRESAKTAKVKFCQCYMICYLHEIMDLTNVVSEASQMSTKFIMDIYNVLLASRIDRYFGDMITKSKSKNDKKEHQAMSRFTTTNGVTYNATSARNTMRGDTKMDVTDKEVDAARPKQTIFDDIESENTLNSMALTEQIGRVMDATIAGLDQSCGWWVFLGNYLSLRGNVAKFINKYADDESVFKLGIPILDPNGDPTWPSKYVATDKEQAELAEKGIYKVSVETIERNSDNFNVEFMNLPGRASVYFDDKCMEGLPDDDLVSETKRDPKTHILTIEEPEAGGTYIISADSAKGVAKDESSYTVIRTDDSRYEEVETFRDNRTRPEQFAGILASAGRRYNNALIIPENNYPGNETIAFLRPIYNNIYHVETKDGKEYGINTNVKTKPEMFLATKKILKSKLLTVRSRALHRQISEYPSSEVTTVRQKDDNGGHFDLLMSLAIGLWKAGTISANHETDEGIDELLDSIMDDVYDDSEESAY